ncbi:MAG: prolyl oligopeptidase family serine peptidase [Anaerolineae bacterium]|nr:prolyl oligopeptidase family serine peptidase [Anaerolineae bacterium]
MTQIPHHFEMQITQTVQLDYLLYLPPGYGGDLTQRWPLLLYLHGAGGRGSDLDLVKRHGIPHQLENGQDLPFIVVSPQCPSDSHWTLHVDALNALLGDVSARYPVDAGRISMTGASMGAAGAWMLAGAYPERFAALAPISGRIVPLPLWRMKDLAIWAFHGEADDVVPVSEAQRTVDALKAMDANVRLSIYPGVGHNLAAQIYDKPELYAWLLTQRRP